jgi:undecaprenyl-diphosphatase
MNWFQAIIVGIVEGITEYLPVSSTGHILLAQRAMGIPDDEASQAFAIVVQAGAILAVLGLYYQKSRSMAEGLLGKNPQGLLLVRNILLAFIPAVIIGLLLEDKIDALLKGLWPTVASWFVGGVAILAVAWFKRNAAPGERGSGLTLEQITPRIALTIGLLQCVAMWPGTSRSLMTIVGGLLCGLNLIAAVEFSFLLGMVTLTAAAGYKFLGNYKVLFEHYSATSMLLGCFAAWLSATLAVKWMVGFLQRRGLVPFGYYRIGLAIVIAALLLTNVITTAPSEPPPPALSQEPRAGSEPAPIHFVSSVVKP